MHPVPQGRPRLGQRTAPSDFYVYCIVVPLQSFRVLFGLNRKLKLLFFYFATGMPPSLSVSALRSEYEQRLTSAVASVGFPIVTVSQVESALFFMGLAVSGDRLVASINDAHDYCFSALLHFVFQVYPKGATDQAESHKAGLAAMLQNLPIHAYPFLLMRDQPDSSPNAGSAVGKSVCAGLLPPTLRGHLIQPHPPYAGTEGDASRFSRPLSLAEFTLIVRCIVDSLEDDANCLDHPEYILSAPDGDIAMGNVFEGIAEALEGGLFDDEVNTDKEGDGDATNFTGRQVIRFLRKFSIELSEGGAVRGLGGGERAGHSVEHSLSQSARRLSRSSLLLSGSGGGESPLLARRKSRASFSTKRPSQPDLPSVLESTLTTVKDEPFLLTPNQRAPKAVSTGLSQLSGRELTAMLVGTVLGRDVLASEGTVRRRMRLREVTAQRLEEVAPPQTVGVDLTPSSPHLADPKAPKRGLSTSHLLAVDGGSTQPSLTQDALLRQLPLEIRPALSDTEAPPQSSVSRQQSIRLPNSKGFLTAAMALTRAASTARLTRQSSLREASPTKRPPLAPSTGTSRGIVDSLATEDFLEARRAATAGVLAAREDTFLCDTFLRLDPAGGESRNSPTGELEELEREAEGIFEAGTNAEVVQRKMEMERLLRTTDRVQGLLRSREVAGDHARQERLQWAASVGEHDGHIGKASAWGKLKFGVLAKPGYEVEVSSPSASHAAGAEGNKVADSPSTKPPVLSDWMITQVHRGRSFLTSEVPVDPEEYRRRSRYLLDLHQHRAVEATRARTPSHQTTPGRVRYSTGVTPLRLPALGNRPPTPSSSTPIPLPALTDDEQQAVDDEVDACMNNPSPQAPPSRHSKSASSVRAAVPDDVVRVTHHKAKTMGLLIPPEGPKSKSPTRAKSHASLAARRLAKRRKQERRRQEEEVLVEWALRRRRDGFKV